MKKNYLKIFHVFLLFLIALIVGISFFIKLKLGLTNYENVIFYVKTDFGKGDSNIFLTASLMVVPITIICTIIFYFMFYNLSFSFKKKKYNIYLLKYAPNHKIIFTFLLFLVSIILLLFSFNYIDYLRFNIKKSNFIEDNYVGSKDVKVDLGEKRNVIVISVESFETSFFTKKQGGYWEYEVIPEMYKLLDEEDTLTFYNKNKAQSMSMIGEASFTTASLISNSSGIPFKVSYDDVYTKDNFLNGSYNFGDLLHDNGYHNEIISSADTAFGAVEEFYTKHGNYTIIDSNNLDKYDLEMYKEDIGLWGFNDNYLFETAKKRLEVISKDDKPFNLELVTVDTHFIDGFIGDYSINKYDEQYENAYATESKLLYDFISWVREQDFYSNTTILILGDHLSMQNSFFKKHNANGDRYIYYCLINPVIKDANTKNRVYTAVDTYPTLIGAMGGTIEGDQLGLGINMFSDKMTYAEKYGIKDFNNKLKMKSNFYNKNIVNNK